MTRWIAHCLAFSAGALAAAVPALPPDKERETFQIAAGFRIELFACEPMVQEPVMMVFDEDSRLWVVEMRGFMHDLTAASEKKPLGRISVLEDTDGDGRADKSTVFLDRLVMPRTVAIVKGGALVADERQLVFAADADGDLRADKTTVIDPNYGSGGNAEHSPNGMMRAMDNWLCNAKSAARYRLIGGEWKKEKTEFRGQYGICQDDWGRLFYNYNWSQLHADLVPPNLLSRNPNHAPASGINVQLTADQRVFPIHATPAINRGYTGQALDESGRARELTSACSPLVNRSGALGDAFRQAAFICEPALNLVKCSLLAEDEAAMSLSAKPLFEDREFLASTDERFRPVWIAGGHDGALYLADMYRGVIQHKTYMTPYLQKQIVERGLESPVHLGRIWRIVPASGERLRKAPRLSKLPPGERVSFLADDNGWVRDAAQRLLVERADLASAGPLIEMALHHRSPLARLHALWSLEGIGRLGDPRLLKLLDDAEPRVRAGALVAFSSAGRALKDDAIKARAAAMLGNADFRSRLQAALVLGGSTTAETTPLLARFAVRDGDLPLARDAVLSGIGGREHQFLREFWHQSDSAAQPPGIGRLMLIESAMASLLRSKNAEGIEAVLDGLLGGGKKWDARHRALFSAMAVQARKTAGGTVSLSRKPPVLASLEESQDAEAARHAAAISAAFAWPGHQPPKPPPSKARPLTSGESKLFAEGRQQFLTTCAVCHGLNGEGMASLGPPLQNSEWTLGDPQRLARIVLHGLEGPVEVAGETWGPPKILPVMPPLNGLTNDQLAAIFTYIRRDWGHEAEPVTVKQISQIRLANQGRIKPWTAAELKAEGEKRVEGK